MNRVLLVVPPFYRMLGGHNNWITLGAAYLGAVLHKEGHYVRIYNVDHVDGGHDLNLSEVFNGYQRYRQLIDDPQHPLWAEIRREIENFAPDWVGISINFTMIARVCEMIADIVKDVDRRTRIVVGGPHATLLPSATLEYESFDYLVRGEGEYALLELVDGEKIEKIKGLSYKKPDGSLVHNPDREQIENLDELPFPDIRLQLKEIRDPNDNFGVIAASRGCPYNCSFCASPRLWNRRVRFRSVGNVLEEIRARYAQYGVRKYYFSDDNFNLNRRYALDLCQQIIASGLKIDWICEVNAKAWSKELAETMKAAGCKRVKMGVESGCDRILRLMQKGTTRGEILKAVRIIKEAGLGITVYFLIGMPTETREEMMETYRLAQEIDTEYISLSVATPQYGTPLYETLMKENSMEFGTEDWVRHFHQSYRTILNENVTPEIVDMFLDLNVKKGFARRI